MFYLYSILIFESRKMKQQKIENYKKQLIRRKNVQIIFQIVVPMKQ